MYLIQVILGLVGEDSYREGAAKSQTDHHHTGKILTSFKRNSEERKMRRLYTWDLKGVIDSE